MDELVLAETDKIAGIIDIFLCAIVKKVGTYTSASAPWRC
jgi:hypothetical protein